ncbi:MAG TPA: ChbG/HpnK family deacetylase [Terriglobales bacterium]|nr:ChbG/HpnK family deacetylase [Terriglobales bacterium]
MIPRTNIPDLSGSKSSEGASLVDQSIPRAAETGHVGLLIVNADDWGQDVLTTNKILECSAQGAVSSVSGMVFMEDSERAATLATERGIETGLHLNFVTPFSASSCPAGLLEHQQRLARYLMRRRLAQVIFHPGLMHSFEYVVAAQFDEFHRLYGADPEKVDGHYHMHLCANVLLQRLIKPGTIVRRNFSFESGEKSMWNRLYRKLVDRSLARRHRITDCFFSLPPLEPLSRLQRIYSLARKSVVELETHPVNAEEYRYLAGGEIFRQAGDVRIGRPSSLSWRARSGEKNRL